MTRSVVSNCLAICESYPLLAVLKAPARRKDSATPREGTVLALMAV